MNGIIKGYRELLMANTMVLLLHFASRQTEEQKRTEDRSISLAFVRRGLTLLSIHRSLLSGHCLLAHVVHRDRLVILLAVTGSPPLLSFQKYHFGDTMADTASTLNFGPQWLHKQFSVPDANGGGGGHGGGGGTGPAGFHVGRGGDHRGGGGGKILEAGYVIIGDAQNVTVT